MEQTTGIIISVTVISSIIAFYNNELFNNFLFSPGRIIENKQIYRIISSAFLHADWMHLVFNMYSFYAFANYMEKKYGPVLILAVYFFSILGGSILSLIINFKNRAYRAIGASGGVCGIIYAYIFLTEGGSIFIFPLPIPIPDWIFAILFLFVSSYSMNRDSRDSIGHDAHLGGALTGMACALVYDPAIIYREYLLIIALIIPVVVIPFVMHKLKRA